MVDYSAFSASKSERAFHCPAAFALPHVAEKPGYPAQRGTFGHSYLEVGLRFGTEYAIDFILGKRVPAWWVRDMEKIDIESVRAKLYALNGETEESSKLYLEPAFSLKDGSVGYLGQNIGRNYPKGADFNGSIDVLLEGLTTNTIVDFKFGSKPVDPECKQLRFLGVLASEYNGRNEAVLSIAQFDKAQGMTLPDPLPSVRLNKEDLALAKKELTDTLNKIQEARSLVRSGELPPINPGSWCNYCEAKGACPEFIGKEENGSLRCS